MFSNKKRYGNPRDDASFFDKWTYRYVESLLDKGEKNPLQDNDLFELANHDKITYVVSKVTEAWDKECANSILRNIEPRLSMAIFRSFRKDFLFSAFLTLLESALKIGQTVLLYYLISWLGGDGNQNEWFGWIIAAAMGLIAILQTLVHHVLFYITMIFGWNMKTAVSGMIHAKVLTLGTGVLMNTTQGQIINLVSNDVQRFVEVGTVFHFSYASILEVFAILALVSWQIGFVSAMAGVGTTIALIPIQVWLTKFFTRFRSNTAKFTDERVKIMGDVISSIASVKAFAWENPFSDLNFSIRKRECASIKKSQILKALNMSISFSSPVTASLATFLVFWAQGNVFEASSVFTALGLLHILRMSISMWSRSIEYIAESVVSLRRIRHFLLLPEMGTRAWSGFNKKNITEELSPNKDEDVSTVLSLKDACFSWQALEKQDTEILNESQNIMEDGRALVPEDERVSNDYGTISNISMEVQRGRLIIIIGPVGCGKSTLLEGILGEAPQVSGSIYLLPGLRVAYAAQKPFIRACTFKENIMFVKGITDSGKNDLEQDSFDASKASFDSQSDELFQTAIKVCALEPDIAALPNGISTEIGERGVNLSGGQKARLSLARTVYSNADLVLLDDPLSAVDPKVSRHLFERCIIDELVKKNKAVVLVTHQRQCLYAADLIVLLNAQGVQVAAGTLSEIEEKGFDLSSGLDDNTEDNSSASSANSEQGERCDVQVDSVKKMQERYTDISLSNVRSDRSTSAISLKNPVKISVVDEEDRVVGEVTASTYIEYARNGTWWRCIGVIFLMIVSQGCFVMSDWWLKYWSSIDEQKQRRESMAWGFGLLVGSTAILGLIRSSLFFNFSITASTNVHRRMYEAVLRSPMSFFNSNPQGRILNRFSNDMGSVDELLPEKAHTAAEILLFVISALLLVCITIPYVIVMIFPMAVLFWIARKRYLSSSREIKRLEAISRSPIYAEFGATLDGLTTLRAFGAEETNHRSFLYLLEKNGKAWYCFILVSRWLGFRLDLETAAFLSCTTLLAAGLKGSIDADLMALALVYTLSLNGQFQWAVRQTAEAETYMTAFERMLHYSRLPAEPDDNAVSSPHSWPQQGNIEFRQLNVRYREDLPLVLKNISFSVPAGSKLGIVARTGAGKSSLVMALLRLNQIVSGDILLDSVSLLKVSLSDARKHISWIPQDPHMFSGTLRFNLDPFSQFSDAQIWEALGSVELAKLIEGKSLGLDMEISEGGLSLSVGQRQLVSLARAALLRNPVIALDESTANVDYDTDKLIQKALRTAEAFKDCTVITIAHRIHTVIDSDMIMVLSNGELVELDNPATLLDNPLSLFSRMVADTNDAVTLRKLARDSSARRARKDAAM